MGKFHVYLDCQVPEVQPRTAEQIGIRMFCSPAPPPDHALLGAHLRDPLARTVKVQAPNFTRYRRFFFPNRKYQNFKCSPVRVGEIHWKVQQVTVQEENKMEETSHFFMPF